MGRDARMHCLKLFGAVSLTLAAGVAHAQRPADQDKMGTGATTKQQPLPGDAKPSPSDKGIKINSKPATKPGKPVVAVKDPAAVDKPGGDAKGPGEGKPAKPEKVAYDYELPGPDGKRVPLASFKGKTLLVVNLARNSSYNAQVAALQKLSEQYKDKGLVVIGVPSNDFGAGEPGTDADIQKVYKTDSKVTFPVMAKASVAGKDEIPFYSFMTTGKSVPPGGPVHWNFTKFLIDKNGKVVARFDPATAPDSPEMLTTLDQVLTGRFKPKKGGGDGEGPGGPPA